VIKKDNSVEEFCSEKLARGIKLAFEKRPFNEVQTQEIIHLIEQQVLSLKMNPVPSKEIGNIVLETLRKKDDVAYLRFLSVYKKFGSAKKFQKEAEKLSS
jgi:transcriptional repressor NrdR